MEAAAHVDTGSKGFVNHVSFALAKEYRLVEAQNTHVYAQSRLEQIGACLIKPLEKVVDWAFKDLTNPATVIALTTAASVAVAAAYYPEELLSVFPAMRHITPENIRLLGFCCTEVSILGAGLRALGRFSNKELYASWLDGRVKVIHVGDQLVEWGQA